MRNENLALREQIDRESMFEEIVGRRKRSTRSCTRLQKWRLSTARFLFLAKPARERS